MESYKNVVVSDFKPQNGSVLFAFVSSDQKVEVAIQYFEQNSNVIDLSITSQDFEFDFAELQCKAFINGQLQFNDGDKTCNFNNGSLTFEHDETGKEITIPLYQTVKRINEIKEFMQEETNKLETERRRKLEQEQNKFNLLPDDGQPIVNNQGSKNHNLDNEQIVNNQDNKYNEFNLFNKPNTNRKERKNGGKLKRPQSKPNNNNVEPQNKDNNQQPSILQKVRNAVNKIPGFGRIIKFAVPTAVVGAIAYFSSKDNNTKENEIQNGLDGMKIVPTLEMINKEIEIEIQKKEKKYKKI
jgi:hypothetical protein